MADIMNIDWDTATPIDEADGQPINKPKAVLGAALATGAAVGVYDGIKRHKIEQRRNEEDQARVEQIMDKFRKKRDAARAKKDEISDRIHDYKKHAIDRKIRDTEDDLNDRPKANSDKKHKKKVKIQIVREQASAQIDGMDEGVGKALGYGALAYTGYHVGKGISSHITKKTLDKKVENDREHEYAFRETPEETARRLKSKLYHKHNELEESATSSNVLSKAW